MEASGAGTTDTTEAAPAAEVPAQGNGVVIVCGLFEPLAVVELVERGPNDVRADSGAAVRGRRTVDENGEVGFDGLIPGDLFFVTGYTDGRYEEFRCVAQDPASSVTLLQPPEQPLAQQQGTGTMTTTVEDVPPAEPDTPTEGEGLPEGVSSPILTEGDTAAVTVDEHLAAEAGALQQQADAEAAAATAADEVAAAKQAEEDAKAASDQAAADAAAQQLADAQAAEQKAKDDAAAAEAQAAESAAAAEAAAQAAPDTADATVQGADGAEAGPAQTTQDSPPAEAAPEAAVPSADQTAPDPSQAVDPAATGAAPDSAQAGTDAISSAAGTDAAAPDAAPVSDSNPASPEAGTPDASESSGTGQANGGAVEQDTAVASTEGATATTTVTSEVPAHDQLVAQAEQLGVPNAASLGDDELRQSITEKNVTPVA